MRAVPPQGAPSLAANGGRDVWEAGCSGREWRIGGMFDSCRPSLEA